MHPHDVGHQDFRILKIQVLIFGDLTGGFLGVRRLARSGQASARNLKRLRGMAALVCVLNLPPQDAALLMHAGIATPAALAACSPERLVRQTGRLERSLGTKRPAVVDLRVAGDWIRRARQLAN